MQTRLADASPMRKDLVEQASAAPAMRLVREVLGAQRGVAGHWGPRGGVVRGAPLGKK
jgi:hypothetical protein